MISIDLVLPNGAKEHWDNVSLNRYGKLGEVNFKTQNNITVKSNLPYIITDIEEDIN